MKMKKFYAVLIAVLIMILSLFNGCSSFDGDKRGLLKGKFKVNGTVYSIPVKANKFNNDDWEIDEDDSWDDLVESHNDKSIEVYLKNDDDVSMYFCVYNSSDEPKKVEDCIVYYVEIGGDTRHESDVFLPNGIQLGKTTPSEAQEKTEDYITEYEYGELAVYKDETSDEYDYIALLEFDKTLGVFSYDFEDVVKE